MTNVSKFGVDSPKETINPFPTSSICRVPHSRGNPGAVRAYAHTTMSFCRGSDTQVLQLPGRVPPTPLSISEHFSLSLPSVQLNRYNELFSCVSSLLFTLINRLWKKEEFLLSISKMSPLPRTASRENVFSLARVVPSLAVWLRQPRASPRDFICDSHTRLPRTFKYQSTGRLSILTARQNLKGLMPRAPRRLYFCAGFIPGPLSPSAYRLAGAHISCGCFRPSTRR